MVLGETTEVYGGEHLLTRRADAQVAQDLIDRIHWWENYTALFGASIDNNPAPGNKLGGLTTIYEKSLGAIAKAGSTPLNQVAGYGERVTERGFVHMDTQATIRSPSRGRSPAGATSSCSRPAGDPRSDSNPRRPSRSPPTRPSTPTRNPIWTSTRGRSSTGSALDELGQEIFEKILSVASGERTKSELAGVGEEEYNPWIIGAML